MKTDLICRLALVLVTVTTTPSSTQILAQNNGQISVSPNVQISRDNPALMHNEVLIAADPLDPKRLLACSMTGPLPNGKRPAGVYVSKDGGSNWSLVLTEDERLNSADPSCTYDVNGSAHFAIISAHRDRTTTQVLKLYTSVDGKTWLPSRVPSGSTDRIDREFLVVDRGDTKYRGRIYLYAQVPQYDVNGNSFRGLALFRSIDGGRTYERSTQRISTESNSALIPGNAVVLSDGTLIGPYAQLALDKRNDGYVNGQPTSASQPNAKLKIIVSTNGGDSIDQVADVSDMYADWRPQVASQIPRLAADIFSSSFRDRLYCVWADGRYAGRTQILLAYSSDKGKTWSKPRLVNDNRLPKFGPLEHSAAMPAVAVNSFGVVGVTWYDRRNSTNDLDYEVRFAASYDGGQTFTDSVRVSEKPNIFDKNTAQPVKGVALVDINGLTRLVVVRDEWLASGDTADLTADANGDFHPVWIDNRTGVRQVWTARVTVKGKVSLYGDPNLADLLDASSNVRCVVVNASFDRMRQEGSLSVQLKNISNLTISVPIKLRILGVNSELGTPAITNAANGLKRDGAIWDFTDLVEGGSLRPGESTGTRTIKFSLSDLAPYENPQGSYKWIFLDFDAVVLVSLKTSSR
jgi:hypothetical protein